MFFSPIETEASPKIFRQANWFGLECNLAQSPTVVEELVLAGPYLSPLGTALWSYFCHESSMNHWRDGHETHGTSFSDDRGA